jgi:hypothetical protein
MAIVSSFVATRRRPGCRQLVRVAVIGVLATGTAAAEVRDNLAVEESSSERPDSIGAVAGVTFDGRSSYGVTGRFAFTERLAIDAQLRQREDVTITDVDLVWQLTRGNMASTFGDSSPIPIRFDVLGGIGLVDRELAMSLGVALRVRAASWLTIDVGMRDEIHRGPGSRTRNDLLHTPEFQLALSLTAPHRRPIRRL